MRFQEPGLEAYLKEIEQVALLTAQEEQELATRISREDDHQARNEMVRRNLRLVVQIATHFTHRGVALMDLIAEGNIGLIRAAERFRADRHTRFSTYATWWIRQHIRRALQTCGPTVRVPGYMVELVTHWRRASQQLTEKHGRQPTDQEVAKHMKISPARIRMIGRAIHAAATTDRARDMSWVFEGAVADDRIASPEHEMLVEATHQFIGRSFAVLTHREKEVLELRYGIGGGEAMTLEKIGRRLRLTRERVRQIESEALAKLKKVIGERNV
jgi:RNA polymerase primary sigma factor